jgi:serine/threonine protein kinase/Flp pilus assembly protein TadD
MIGPKLSHYSILERIGSGGMGEVYKAFDPRLDRTIALKVLSRKAVASELKKQRFLQEARAVSSLNHPNILTIYEIGQEEDRYYIATEFIEGETLRHRLRSSGPIPAEFALEIAIQIARALGAAHAAGIVHRDIKPENIMIRPDGYVKVLDFGLAKLLEPSPASDESSAGKRLQLVKTKTNKIIGTVRYMSPEQAQGLPVDHHSDIFSFGILLYEMLTSRAPFNGRKAADIVYEIVSADPTPLADLISGPAIELQPLINRCLEKDPRARYQDAQSLLKDLRELQRRIELWQEQQSVDYPRVQIEAEQITLATRQSVLIIYFENLSGAPELEWWRNGLMELLSLRLMTNQHLDVVSGECVADIMAQLGRNGNGGIDKATVWEISRRSGAEICIVGSFMVFGSVSVSAHLHEVATGRLIASLSARRSRPDELFGLVDEIADRIERELRVARQDLEPRGAASLATGSVQALCAFVEGLERYYRADFVAAAKQFERALELDPGFVLACYYLARIERLKIERNSERLDLFLGRAIEGLSRLSEREGLLVVLEEAAVQQNHAVQSQLAEEFILKFPREKAGYLFLGESYRWRGECERALAAFQQALALDPRLLLQDGEMGSIFESFLDTGRFELAEELAGRQSAVDPKNWFSCYLLGIALFYSQRYEEAVAAFTRAAALDGSGSLYPGLWQARIKIMEGDFDAAERQLVDLMKGRSGRDRSLCLRDLADTLRERGRFRDWLDLLSREKDPLESETGMDSPSSPFLRRSYFFEQMGEMAGALEELEREIQKTDNVWGHVHMGRLSAACGQYERALELAERVKMIGRYTVNPKVERLSLFVFGSIEFYRGNYELAIKFLERSIWSYYNGFAPAIRMLANCLRRTGQYEHSLELLDWIQPYGVVSSSRFSTRTELDLEIAKTYEAAGERERAIDFYSRCLQAWATADAEFVGRLEAEAGLHYLTRF